MRISPQAPASSTNWSAFKHKVHTLKRQLNRKKYCIECKKKIVKKHTVLNESEKKSEWMWKEKLYWMDVIEWMWTNTVMHECNNAVLNDCEQNTVLMKVRKILHWSSIETKTVLNVLRSVFSSVCLLKCLSFEVSVFWSVCLFKCLSFQVSVFSSVCLFQCLSKELSFELYI